MTASAALSEYDLGWLVGLIEGEGSFTSWKTEPRVLLKMTDRDTVERFAALLGTRVTGPYSYPGQQLGTKPYYMARISGARARSFMASTRTRYSARRQEQVAALLGNQLDMAEGSRAEANEVARGTT